MLETGQVLRIKKEITVKIVSAKPTYPDKILVKNPDTIKDTEKKCHY